MKKLLIICTLLGTTLVYAAWDNDLPADNQVWNTAAKVIRDNWDALEVEMGIDLALNHPYYQAATPTFKPDGLTALDSTDLGRIWIDLDDNKMYVFTAVTPTWTPYPTTSGTNTWISTQTFSVAPTWTLGVVANNTFLTATDNAGTGTVDLIKANTSDIAVIPDGSQLATSGAPTQDAGISNKKYVDDSVGITVVSDIHNGSNTPSRTLTLTAGTWFIEVIVFASSGDATTDRDILINGVDSGDFQGTVNQDGDVTGYGVGTREITVGAGDIVCTVSGALATSLFRNSVFYAKATKVSN